MSDALSLADFDFDLPEALIALRPAEPRDHARLLHVTPEGLEDGRVDALPDLLRPGDVLVFNDTRVIPARLFGERSRDGAVVPVEAILLDRTAPDGWTSLMKPGKRVRPGDRLSFGDRRGASLPGPRVEATVLAKSADGEVHLRFDLAGEALDHAIQAAAYALALGLPKAKVMVAHYGYEVAEAERLMRREGIPMLSTTTKSIEEISTTVLQDVDLHKHTAF